MATAATAFGGVPGEPPAWKLTDAELATLKARSAPETTLEERILIALRTSGRLSESELVLLLIDTGASRREIRHELFILMELGRVRELRQGVYAVPRAA